MLRLQVLAIGAEQRDYGFGKVSYRASQRIPVSLSGAAHFVLRPDDAQEAVAGGERADR